MTTQPEAELEESLIAQLHSWIMRVAQTQNSPCWLVAQALRLLAVVVAQKSVASCW